MWGWPYSIEYSPTFRPDVGNIWEYYMEYCQSHITILWIWIMLWGMHNAHIIQTNRLARHLTLKHFCLKKKSFFINISSNFGQSRPSKGAGLIDRMAETYLGLVKKGLHEMASLPSWLMFICKLSVLDDLDPPPSVIGSCKLKLSFCNNLWTSNLHLLRVWASSFNLYICFPPTYDHFHTDGKPLYLVQTFYVQTHTTMQLSWFKLL